MALASEVMRTENKNFTTSYNLTKAQYKELQTPRLHTGDEKYYALFKWNVIGLVIRYKDMLTIIARFNKIST